MFDNVRTPRWGAGKPKESKTATTFCPDCELEIASDAFIAHREQEHPPHTLTIAVPGIKSESAFGWDPLISDDPALD